MNSQNQTIAILDSGVGGLSIFNTVRSALPSYSIVYGCDNKNFPYGPKDSETVIRCITELTQKVIHSFSPEIIIIACNTASTVALESLRKLTSIPIVGVVPAIKPAAAGSKSKAIGLLATPGTVQRAYTDKLIKDHAANCSVVKVGSTRLVEIAEEKLRGKEVNLEEIKREIAPFFKTNDSSKIDSIVLGCTHFPLLLEELRASEPYPIQWVDSSEAIASRVQALSQTPRENRPCFVAVFTELTEQTQSLVPHLKQLGFSQILKID